MLDFEKKLYKKRALLGYNPKNVRKHIQFLNDAHENKRNILEQQLLNEKEINRQLKEELELKKINNSINLIPEEINKGLMDIFIQHTKSIMELKDELQEQEAKHVYELETKKHQKELAQKHLQDALSYLKELPKE